MEGVFFSFVNLSIVDAHYHLSYSCTTCWFTIFKGYIPFRVTIKYWLCSLCYTVYPCSLVILYIIVCIFNPLLPSCPSPLHSTVWATREAPKYSIQFSSFQLLSHVWLLATPWTSAHQFSLFFTMYWRFLKLMCTESVMPSNHLILCRPLLLLPSIFPSIRVFSNESVLCIRWPKY